jgi:hypothetical protein
MLSDESQVKQHIECKDNLKEEEFLTGLELNELAIELC